MKKLFLAFALTGIVGAMSVTTVAAATHAKIAFGCGEDCKHKKGEKCSKGEKCCKSKTTATANGKCSKEGEKKCCSHGKTSSEKTTTIAPDAKPAEKAADQK